MKNEIINNEALTVRVNTEAVADAAEAVVDAVEDVATEVVTITRNNPIVLVGVALVAGAVGGVAGYHYAKRKLVMHYDEIMVREMDRTRDFFRKLEEDVAGEETETSEDAPTEEDKLAKGAVDALKTYRGNGPDRPPVVDYTKASKSDDGTTVVNPVLEGVLVNGQPMQDDFDYASEMAQRDPTVPYVISFDEFSEQDKDYNDQTLTWYAGDRTLADANDQLMDDPDATVGLHNMERFGHGSRDSKVVYVRNERIEMDFEVCLHETTYREEVLGEIG